VCTAFGKSNAIPEFNGQTWPYWTAAEIGFEEWPIVMTYAQASHSACVALLCTMCTVSVSAGNAHPSAQNSSTNGITVFNDAITTAMFILHRMS
jgi:hypothetical protein